MSLDIFTIFSTQGVWVGVSAALAALLGVYMRRDWKRLDLLEKRVIRLEEEQREAYLAVIQPCQQALLATNKLIERYLSEH